MDILIVEDNKGLNEIISLHLEKLGYSIQSEYSGNNGYQQILNSHYKLIILDYYLPNYTGIELLKKIREKGNHTPVIMITSCPKTEIELTAFKEGVNLYHSKPINFNLFSTQIDNLLGFAQNKNITRMKSLIINPNSKSIIINNHNIDLTPTEIQLLNILAKQNGNIVRREHIYHMLQNSTQEIVTYNWINTLVCRIRSKLSQYNLDNILSTKRGLGYKLDITKIPPQENEILV